ncbi:MAG: hypothetical protein ABR577_17115 [Pyrinomonadaceae bacterium]
MVLEIVYSINDVPIRLTDERWDKIVDSHPYMTARYEQMLDTMEDPEYIFQGHGGTLVAVKVLGKKSFLNVMYREIGDADGFIITAFITTKLDKKRAIWRRDS